MTSRLLTICLIISYTTTLPPPTKRGFSLNIHDGQSSSRGVLPSKFAPSHLIPFGAQCLMYWALPLNKRGEQSLPLLAFNLVVSANNSVIVVLTSPVWQRTGHFFVVKIQHFAFNQFN